MGGRRSTPRTPGAHLLVPLAVALTVGSPGCGGGGHVPTALVDGTRTSFADVRLEGVRGPVVLARARRYDRLTGALAVRGINSCLQADWSGRPDPPVVHRVGTSGESVTFEDGSGRGLQACDGAGGAARRRWCGHVFGQLRAGRLSDPRLDLGGCRTTAGRPIAFAWIEPGSGTRYVVVRRDGFAEAYEASAGLPVRVSVTESVDLARWRAVVEATEHSRSGRLLRTHVVEAAVSG